jgi:hypothetical protein
VRGESEAGTGEASSEASPSRAYGQVANASLSVTAGAGAPG